MPRESEIVIDPLKVRRLLLEQCGLKPAQIEKAGGLTHTFVHRALWGKGKSGAPIVVVRENACALVRIATDHLKQAVPLSTIEYLDRQEPSQVMMPGTPGFSLTTCKHNPQWADYRVFPAPAACPWALRCTVVTASPYFRFGTKLLEPDGRVFGDGAINSYDANLLVHIGRNNWDRPKLGISAQDIFFTAYMSGSQIEDDDRFLFRAGSKVGVAFELLVDSSYFAKVAINGALCFQRVVPPALCRRVAVYAWGDREEFDVEVKGLTILAV